MTWAVWQFPIKEPAAVDALMLAFGKSLHLACEFESKCQYVLRILKLGEMFKITGDAEATFAAAAVAKDRLLGKTIEGMAKISAVTPEEIHGLTKARIARNYIAHECGKIGSFHDLRVEHIAEAFAAFRPAVIDLARGDNIISIWYLAIQEKRAAPEWMTETYEARVLNWIFGEPFQGVSSWDDWALIQLAKQSK
jgi:hypothetical protein